MRTLSNFLDDVGNRGILRRSVAQQIGDQLRIRKCQKFAKRLLLRIVHVWINAFEKTGQQDVELAHGTPALPFEL